MEPLITRVGILPAPVAFWFSCRAAKIMGLNTEQMVNALAVAGSTSAGLGEFNSSVRGQRGSIPAVLYGRDSCCIHGQKQLFWAADGFEGKEGFRLFFL